MQRFIIVRCFHSLLALWIISMVVFGLIRVTGSPVDALMPGEGTQADRLALEEYWGLNEPIVTQYLKYMGKMFQGDLGDSFKWRGTTTKDLIAQRLPATAQLAGLALLISVVFSVPLGVLTAVRRDGLFDRGGKGFAMLGQALPPFWLGIILIWILAVKLNWLPTSGRGGISHIILPAITLGWFQVAAIMRLVRSSMLDVLDSEYVKMARIKGLPEWKVVWKHCLRNATIAPLTYFGVITSALLVGSITTETVFSWPGLGQLILGAALGRDFAVVQAVVLLFAGFYIVGNLLVDILYAYLDPRIRYT